jgi:LAO/AO transport system kinase
VFAVNKADRDGADATVRDLELMLALGRESMVSSGKQRGHVVHSAVVSSGVAGAKPLLETWTPPIVKCVALRGEGTSELVEALERHHAWVRDTAAGRARRHARLAEELRETLREALIDAAEGALGDALDEAVAAVESKSLDPYTATEQLVARFSKR